MAKPKFPLVVKRGSATVKIYLTPLARRVGRQRRRYNAYTVVYTFANSRRRKKFHDLDQAKRAAEDAVTLMANGEMGRRHLSETEASEYLASTEALGELGVGVLHAVREYAEAKRHLGDTHLVQAAQFFKRYAGDSMVPFTVPAAVKKLLEHKLEERVGAHYHYDLANRLNKFAAAFTGDLAAVTTEQINRWLKSLGAEPRTHNNYRAAIVQLFNFARAKLKALPHWLPHAADEAVRVREPVNDSEIYSPAEMRTILENAPKRLISLIAIRAFSGIRNAELWKVAWSDFDFVQRVIKLKASVTKVGSRRVMPLLPNLRTWLGDSAPEGRVAEGYASAKTLSEAISNAIEAAGVDPRRNALRNSYTSYRLAVLGEVGKVAEETGNSPAVIKREYLELTTPDRAAEWFSIVPAH